MLNFDINGDGINDSFVENFDTNLDGMDDFIRLDIDGDGVTDATFQDTNFDGIDDYVKMDMDGDGVFETEQMDVNGDGVIDVETVDTDGDGIGDYTKMDTDGDGFLETEQLDIDGDGVTDIEAVDTDFDGITDEIYIDSDGDGNVDHIEYDTDGDGTMDTIFYNADTDGDGVFDTTMQEIYEDIDGDGEFDKVTILEYDSAEDEFEVLEIRDLDTNEVIDDDNVNKDDLVEIEPIFYDENSNGINSDIYDNFDPATADMDKVIGDPGSAMEVWECQGDTGRCALYAQMFIIEEYTGQDIDIEQFADIAEANGWFTEEGGTPIVHVGKMLEYYGLETETSTGNDLSDIADALNNGEKVIVGVDSEEYWYGENDDMFTPNDGANHAIEVIGIDYSDPDNPMVIINDSGNPNGCGDMIPYQTFMDAWEDSDCMMVVCSGEES